MIIFFIIDVGYFLILVFLIILSLCVFFIEVIVFCGLYEKFFVVLFLIWCKRFLVIWVFIWVVIWVVVGNGWLDLVFINVDILLII